MWLRIALTEAAQVAARGKGTYLAAAPPATTSSPPTTTSFATTFPTRIWDRTGTTAADPPSNKPDDSCDNSNGWA